MANDHVAVGLFDITKVAVKLNEGGGTVDYA